MSEQPTQTGPQRLVGGRYRLIDVIGRGAVADVWRACDERLERDVALKMFRGDAAEELGSAQAEVRTLAKLGHPGLVDVYDAGSEDDGDAWVVMQLVEGQSLSKLLDQGILPPADVARIGAELAAALAYVHDRGFVHRDVKPANVLVSDDGRVQLADFGIARLVDQATSRLTKTGQVLGTPAYLAPEQVAGEPVGSPADVYALGLVLLECLTGHREYEGGAFEAAVARLHRQPEVPPQLPMGLTQLLEQMTARAPEQRPTAADVEHRLRRAAAGLASEETVTMAAVDPPTEAAPRATDTQVLPPLTPGPAVRRPPAGAPRRRAPLAIPVLVLGTVLLAAVVALVVLGASHSTSGSSFTPGSPRLPQPYESAVQRLEKAVHK